MCVCGCFAKEGVLRVLARRRAAAGATATEAATEGGSLVIGGEVLDLEKELHPENGKGSYQGLAPRGSSSLEGGGSARHSVPVDSVSRDGAYSSSQAMAGDAEVVLVFLSRDR